VETCASDLVERARPIGPSDRILDLGCGTGSIARVLRERLGGAASIAGVDVSAAMIEAARSIAPELEFLQVNAVALPFADGSFDLVLCQDLLRLGPDLLAALCQVRRILSAGGRLIASTWSLDGLALDEVLQEAGFIEIRTETVPATLASVVNAVTPRNTNGREQ
jgi:ubiquinone/menaquinone biosynthesis C-methylase UbiE